MASYSEMSHPIGAEGADSKSAPKSLGDLFVSFTVLALQGVGGVLAIVQRELVEHKRWLTNEEFVEDWAVAQIMPGPNVVNLSLMVGSRFFGLPGALAALAGMLAVPLLIVLALALVYAEFASDPRVLGMLRGMSAVAAGLVTATGLKLTASLRRNVVGVPLCAIAGTVVFIAVALLKVPLAWVLLIVGGSCFAIAWRKLA